MKKINFILVVFALVMTLTQCKKNEEQPTANDNVVTITLNLSNNNGSKVNVNPSMGTVDFESGDKIYVGSGGKYVGFLTHNGTNFVGNITNPIEGQPLQFYFLGNVTPQETLSAGTTEECSVIISDQTEHLPVISCAPSFENYVSGVTAYTGHLLNKCALVKFNVTTPSNSPICITGMKNKVTVDFANNTLTPSQDGEGVITLPAGSGENVEKWAILLPQEALPTGVLGTAFSNEEAYVGERPAIPAITENGYLTGGLSVIVNTSVAPIGSINGLFSVSDTKQVYFSKGNLQYQASTNKWRFALNQWDYVGEGNANISQTYSGWIDLFGWGTSGYDHGAICYQPYSMYLPESYYYAYGQSAYNLYDQTGQADWGYNQISNGGDFTNMWRTLTGGENGEWYYLFNIRSASKVNGKKNARYAKARVANVEGVIIFPDNYLHPSSVAQPIGINNEGDIGWYGNNYNTIDFDLMQDAGAVFLPAAGERTENSVHNIGDMGEYWSASSNGNNGAYYIVINYGCLFSQLCANRPHGLSVRLVQDFQP